ncbi:MAG: hypothetical protein ACRDT6_00320 [Micromonosporaceae bacterium]
MSGHRRAHTYAVRPSIGGPPILTAVADRQSELLILQIPSGEFALDVVTARACWMLISEALYQERSVRLSGPILTLECDPGTGRPSVVRRDGR